MQRFSGYINVNLDSRMASKEDWENSGVELHCLTSPTEKLYMCACCLHNVEMFFVGESSEMAGEWRD